MKKTLIISTFAIILISVGIAEVVINREDTVITPRLPVDIESWIDSNYQNIYFPQYINYESSIREKIRDAMYFQIWNGTGWENDSIDYIAWVDYSIECKKCLERDTEKCVHEDYYTYRECLDLKRTEQYRNFFKAEYQKANKAIHTVEAGKTIVNMR